MSFNCTRILSKKKALSIPGRWSCKENHINNIGQSIPSSSCYYSKSDFTLGKLSGNFNELLQIRLSEVYIPADLVLHQNFRKSTISFQMNIPELSLDVPPPVDYSTYNQRLSSSESLRGHSINMSSMESLNFFRYDQDNQHLTQPPSLPLETYSTDVGPSLLVPSIRPRAMLINPTHNSSSSPGLYCKPSFPFLFTPPISSILNPNTNISSLH